MNSIFPFTVESEVPDQASGEELPVFRELAYDYENNRLLRRGGKPYLIEKDEALKVWIYSGSGVHGCGKGKGRIILCSGQQDKRHNV